MTVTITTINTITIINTITANITEVLDENRGSSYFTGADENWRGCPSVHNFIKVCLQIIS